MTCIHFFKIPYLTFVRWIVDFEIKFSNYYLMMAILMKRRVDTGTHYRIWLRGEDKIDTGNKMSLNVSRLINNLLLSKLRSYSLNFTSFRGSCITSMRDFALNSPMATIKKVLVAKTASRVTSKLLSPSD